MRSHERSPRPPLPTRRSAADDSGGRHRPSQFDSRHAAAAREFIARVLTEVPAELVQASLFGSRARGDAHAQSDVDVLLVFRRLPPDREPQAGQAEAIAEEVARATGVPVTTWSVSLPDLARGTRTPMLVDALADSIPLWRAGEPLHPVPFTPEDALWCTDRLLTRVEEGGYEVAWALDAGDGAAAARRARDDLVRLCTALLLLRGVTRPRRAAAVRAISDSEVWPPDAASVLQWAAESYGPGGRDEELPLAPPPGGLPAFRAALHLLRDRVLAAGDRLEIQRRGAAGAVRNRGGDGHRPCTPQAESRASTTRLLPHYREP